MTGSRRAGIAAGTFAVGIVAVNLVAAWFARTTGGYGLLDLHGGHTVLDPRADYTPAQAHALLTAYGPAGRTLHLWLTLTVDLAFPALLAVVATILLRHAYGGGRWFWLAGLVYALADYTENGFIVALLRAYPAEPAWLAIAADRATAVKTVIFGLLVVAILAGYVRGAVSTAARPSGWRSARRGARSRAPR